MRKLVMDDERRTLVCEIDLVELRIRALYDAKCSVWHSAQLRDHVEKETDCSFKCSFTSESGTRFQFNSTTRRRLISHMVTAHGFYDPVQRAVIANECPWFRSISLHDAQHLACSSFLHSFRRTGGSHVQTETKQPLLLVVCPLCIIDEVANQDSESSSLPHAESDSLQFSSDRLTTASPRATCLCLVSRERGLQKWHSFVAPTMLPWRDLLRSAVRAE